MYYLRCDYVAISLALIFNFEDNDESFFRYLKGRKREMEIEKSRERNKERTRIRGKNTIK